ncbi:MAG: CrcB family protein, partial [Propionibacterium sp.]|nr:CrcB family protein [Propionibacterium sp.]
GDWPMDTFTVNLVGCLALGWLLEGLARSGPDEGWRRLVRLCLGTGFCGSFTTYSSLATETALLGRDRPVLAASYLAVSVVAGVLAAWVGVRMAARSVRTASRGASARGRHRASTRPDESSSHLPAHSTPSRHSPDVSDEGPHGTRDQHPLRGGQQCRSCS